jgi:ATPase family associated with various cellular activities (AAA)
MPELLHSSSPTRATAARSSRSLLRAAGAAYAVNPQGAAGAYVNDLCAGIFLAAVERDGLRHVRSAEVERQHETLGDLERFGRVELSWRTESGEDAVVSLPGGELVLLIGWEGACEVVVAGREPATVRRACDTLARALRQSAPRRDELMVRFWANGGGNQGAHARRRRLDAPEWAAIARNYPPAVRQGLGRLVRARHPGRGTVLLWHGAPGTGKTHALRALARAWRGWCALHYVTDPDSFLTGTDYLMSVATASPDEGEPAWRLIVLEDAGELMGASARADTGQGLSRILNLTDGLLGQGQRCLLLVTTNEPVGRLHPALRRPGRCWAEVEFAPFSAREAAAWLRRRGAPRRAPAGGTLAELYALAEDRVLAEPPREAFGFGRAVARS